ncbi:hypothetical protein TNIN_137991 [Trichonephila inaurata madagascariensis]|uniref:Uncharacterized protein n=1 Tax=Trichonephila inaurata madagascariensis TaxID=2747483 RepID=A0A8X6X2A7_9ARAC|nr:hypothetical protein TNIN_137991 [Trichonephila inaurata madagascariensis]
MAEVAHYFGMQCRSTSRGAPCPRHSLVSWNFKKAEWNTFTATTEQELHSNRIDFTLHPSRICELINDKILFCAKTCIPRGRVKKFRCLWSEKLKYMKIKHNRLRRKVKLTHKSSDVQLGRKQLELFRKKTGLFEKQKSFNDFVSGANYQRDSMKVFKFLSGFKNESKSAPKQHFQIANKTITYDTEIVNAFVKYFTNSHQKNKHTRLSSRVKKCEIKSLVTDFGARVSSHPIFNSSLSLEELT